MADGPGSPHSSAPAEEEEKMTMTNDYYGVVTGVSQAAVCCALLLGHSAVQLQTANERSTVQMND